MRFEADPRALLQEAVEAWSASASWDLTARAGSSSQCVAAVRQGLQWMSLGAEFRVLIQGDRALLGGVAPLAMLGWRRSGAQLRAVIGDRWVSCDRDAYLATGRDASAFGMFSKTMLLEPATPLEVLRVDRVGGVRQVGLTVGGDPVELVLGVDGPRIVSFGYFCEDLNVDVRYGSTEPPVLPAPVPSDIVPLDLVAEQLSKGGRGVAARRAPSRRALDLHVMPAEDGGYCLRSEGLADALRAPSALDAQAAVVLHLHNSLPGLLAGIEFDSYERVFLAYAASATQLDDVAAVVREFVRTRRT